MPDYSDRQFGALTQMGDLTSQEQDLARQQALSAQLRNQALQASTGKDVGSQVARGLQGAMAGYGMMRGQAQQNALAANRQKVMDQIRQQFAPTPTATGVPLTVGTPDPGAMAG